MFAFNQENFGGGVEVAFIKAWDNDSSYFKKPNDLDCLSSSAGLNKLLENVSLLPSPCKRLGESRSFFSNF